MYYPTFRLSSGMSQGADSSEELAISMQDVSEAMGRIREHVHYTPVLTSSHLNSVSGLDLFFKCELFQKTGSFKVRDGTVVSKFLKSGSLQWLIW